MTDEQRRRAQRIVERQLSRSDAALATLREAGLAPDAVVELDFSFVASNREAAESLRADLAGEDCQSVEVKKHPGLFSRKLVVSGKSQPAALGTAFLRQWLPRMVAQGMAHDCKFDGWSAPVPVAALITHAGGCHCGRVRFEVIAPAKLQVLECNCSICSKAGYLHLVVPADRFKLLSGAEALTAYSFNTHTAKHLFCPVCGIKSFYVPRADPFSRSVNVRCLDPGTVEEMSVSQFNGRQWGRAIHGR